METANVMKKFIDSINNIKKFSLSFYHILFYLDIGNEGRPIIVVVTCGISEKLANVIIEILINDSKH